MRHVYLAATGQNRGKTTVSLGVLDGFRRRGLSTGFLKPVGQRTIIEDGVFIGSDTQLVAPVKVGAGSVIAAGTTVTQDVPLDSLVISRVMQVTRPGWAAKRRALLTEDTTPKAQRTRVRKNTGKTTARQRKAKPSKRRSR